MNVIMVAEDIKKDGSFKQSKGELMCTVSNLAFIKHYHPNFKTILFVDRYTKPYYEQFGIIELFDEVNDTLLDQEVEIDKEIFWAAGKLMAQSITESPTITMDLDFCMFSNLEKFGVFDSDISCLWLEETDEEFYFTPEQAMNNSGLNWKFSWDNKALNVSFLYLKNKEFKRIYCDLALNYMRSMYGKVNKSELFKENTKYILFAEQYMLYQLSKKYTQNIKVLIDDFYEINPTENVKSIGINLKNCVDHFYHMGNHKEHFRKKNEFAQNGYKLFYEKTIKMIRDDKFINIIDKLNNMSEYERCFC